MRLLFAGTPDTAVPSLQALLASDHDVVAVLTRPDARAGRGGKLTPSPIAEVAREQNLPVLAPTSLRDATVAQQIRELGVDGVAVVAYGALITDELLAIPSHGWVNLHFSLLPAWRGASPVPAAIRAGDTMTGATTFVIDSGLDTGPILGTITEPIGPRDTAGDVLQRLAHTGAGLLVATFDGLASGNLQPIPQPTDGISHAGKILTSDGEIDFTQPAFAIDRHIRALTPQPGCWTSSPWGRLRLGPVTPQPAAQPLAPGAMRAEKKRVLVGTATEPVQLSTVQAPGKKAMNAADWARGARPDVGQRLGGESA